MQRTWILLGVIVCLIVIVVINWRRIAAALGPSVGKMMGEAYMKRFMKQLKQKYPQLAARVQDFEMTPDSQGSFEAAMKRLPPQEAMKLQMEFNRLRDNFMVRHPEVQPLFSAGQDPRAQAKAMDDLLKLPEDKRQALEKDLIWAWDRLRSSFPKLMGPLEAAFRKKATPVESSKG